MKHIDLAKELELNEYELLFRNYYLSHPDNQKNVVMSVDSALSIFQKINLPSDEHEKTMATILSEDLFIEDNTAVAVYKHMRYLPAFFHTHNFFEIIYVFTGHATQYFSDCQVELHPGDVYIIPPGTSHAIYNFSDCCIIINMLIRSSNFDSVFFNILSEKDVIANFFSRCLYTQHDNSYLYFPTDTSSAISDFAAYIYYEYQHNKRYKYRMINSLISAFFTLLLREYEKSVIVASNTIEKYDSNIILILNYIQNNFKTVTLAELAQIFHYSERHLGRIIREHCGCSFSELIRTVRLGTTEQLLRTSELSIQTIAEMSGYENMSHFYRVFKAHYGLSPNEYRLVCQK